MSVIQITFSPTGGTQKIANSITNALKMPVKEVDLTNADTHYNSICMVEDDIAVIAVPSYGGRIPSLATQRISKICGNQAKCIIVCVYGNRAYEDTLIELKDAVEKSGFRVIAAIAAVAEHSIMHQYATGRPDARDKQELQNFAKRILDKIKYSESEISTPQVPGNYPYKKAGGALLVPKVNNKCTNCGLCAKNCPVQAINKENFKITDSKKCISCMRCVVKCPQSARKVNGGTA